MPKVQNPADVSETAVKEPKKKEAQPKKEKSAPKKEKAPTKKEKATPKKEKEAAPKKEEPTKVDRAMGVDPPEKRKVVLINALRKAGAVKAMTAVPVTKLCSLTKYSRFDVYGLVNGTSGKVGSNPRCLLACGMVATTDIEGEGLAVYLTAKGQKTPFDVVPFVKK